MQASPEKQYPSALKSSNQKPNETGELYCDEKRSLEAFDMRVEDFEFRDLGFGVWC